MTHTETLSLYTSEHRLIRGFWEGTNRGVHHLSILAALSPEALATKDASACPATLMPKWFAHLTVWFNDEGSEPAFTGMAHKYASLAPHFHILSETAWSTLALTCQKIILSECIRQFQDNLCVVSLIQDAIHFIDTFDADKITLGSCMSMRNAIGTSAWSEMRKNHKRKAYRAGVIAGAVVENIIVSDAGFSKWPVAITSLAKATKLLVLEDASITKALSPKTIASQSVDRVTNAILNAIEAEILHTPCIEPEKCEGGKPWGSSLLRDVEEATQNNPIWHQWEK